MPRKTLTQAEILEQLILVQALQPEVQAWRDQGYAGVTQTTAELLAYWFSREEATTQFHPCQREAIETIVYCHEILETTSLRNLYDRVAPEVIAQSVYVQSEVDAIPFPKYCLKMATGSGKTWVLGALVVWQFFNALNGEKPGRYSFRFVVVAPGKEVLNRLLDAFKGRRDAAGSRDPNTADYKLDLFMPETAQWRSRFHLEILDPDDVRPNTTAPDGPFVFITNWQQFRLKKDKQSLWDKTTGADVEEQPRGEVLANFLSEFPDLVVMNDEAHHVHAKRGKENEELVWRRFMKVVFERLNERHPDDRGLFLQVDYSATPFYGSGHKREYFPHIVYDYPLLSATGDMLVKQLFLEQRQAIGGERLAELDFRAVREEEGSRRGIVTGLSPGQKVLLDIGRTKLEQIASEFAAKGIQKKPVMMVLCEQTEVSQLVVRHFATLADERGNAYDDSRVMQIHTDLKDSELENARKRLDKIDENSDPLRVVVSVLMLREGFDKKNICVVAVLRATEADLLLEQIVGRGLRLMFPEYESSPIWEAKKEALDLIRRKRTPSNSFDFLFVVEHPRFRQFYEDLRKQGYLIGEGDSTQTRATGDLIPVDALPDRIPEYDIAWPVQIYDQGKLPDLSGLDVSQLNPFGKDFEALKKELNRLIIQDVHVGTGVKAKTWKLENKYFDFAFFLAQAVNAISKEGRDPLLTGRKAEIARLVDTYVSSRLFDRAIDFTAQENYTVLNYTLVFEHIVQTVRQALLRQVEAIRFEVRAGQWRKLSDLARIFVREKSSVETTRCIYPRQPVSAVAGGLERNFMADTLEQSPEVLAYSKLDRKHPLKISYRDKSGIQRDYEVDFVVKTAQSMFLVETKGDRDLESATVGLKARAAQSWCETASGVAPPEGFNQPEGWEYIIVSEGVYKANSGLSFDGLVSLCRPTRDQLISREERRLFV